MGLLELLGEIRTGVPQLKRVCVCVCGCVCVCVGGIEGYCHRLAPRPF